MRVDMSLHEVNCSRYKTAENQLVVFADDIMPRHTQTIALLDYDTVAVSDKFGTINIVSDCTCCV